MSPPRQVPSSDGWRNHFWAAGEDYRPSPLTDFGTAWIGSTGRVCFFTAYVSGAVPAATTYANDGAIQCERAAQRKPMYCQWLIVAQAIGHRVVRELSTVVDAHTLLVASEPEASLAVFEDGSDSAGVADPWARVARRHARLSCATGRGFGLVAIRRALTRASSERGDRQQSRRVRLWSNGGPRHPPSCVLNGLNSPNSQ